jgi:hypothetical protein
MSRLPSISLAVATVLGLPGAWFFNLSLVEATS